MAALIAQRIAKEKQQMIGNTFQQLFLVGANALAIAGKEYGVIQQQAGFTEDEWSLLTSTECWTKAQQMQMPSVIANLVSITLRTAGLPPAPLPGAFVASCICKVVQPCNRLVAAASAPESFDAMSASGIASESVKVITTKEQMYALVVYFSSAEFGALENFHIDEAIEAAVASGE